MLQLKHLSLCSFSLLCIALFPRNLLFRASAFVCEANTDRFEPNDAPDQAIEVAAGVTYERLTVCGGGAAPGDQDYYQVVTCPDFTHIRVFTLALNGVRLQPVDYDQDDWTVLQASNGAHHLAFWNTPPNSTVKFLVAASGLQAALALGPALPYRMDIACGKLDQFDIPNITNTGEKKKAPPVVQLGSHFYRFVTAMATFADAVAAAGSSSYQGLAGHMVTVGSAEESALVTGLLQNYSSAMGMWLGASRSESVYPVIFSWTSGPERGIPLLMRVRW